VRVRHRQHIVGSSCLSCTGLRDVVSYQSVLDTYILHCAYDPRQHYVKLAVPDSSDQMLVERRAAGWQWDQQTCCILQAIKCPCICGQVVDMLFRRKLVALLSAACARWRLVYWYTLSALQGNTNAMRRSNKGLGSKRVPASSSSHATLDSAGLTLTQTSSPLQTLGVTKRRYVYPAHMSRAPC
jgi:hypothetical protein